VSTEIVAAAGQADQQGTQSVELISRALAEPPWLLQWRRRAFETFQATALPHRATHLWRYTDPATFEPTPELWAQVTSAGSGPGGRETDKSASGSPASAGPASGRSQAERPEAGGGDSRGVQPVLPDVLPESARAAGLVLTSIAEAAREHPELLRRVLGHAVGPEFGRYEALNAALFQDGLFLYVPRNAQVETPVHLLRGPGGSVPAGSAPLPGRGAALARLAVLVEEGASLTLIDECSGDFEGGRGTLYGVTETVLGAEARVNHAFIQDLGERVRSHITQRAVLDRGAVYRPVLVSFGGGLSKVDAGAVLQGPGAESELTGFVSGAGRQRFDHHTVHHHVGPRTRSNLDFKTVLAGRARSAYTGLIRIEPPASFTEAYQENRNLLLSEHCRAESIPELEIMTEEVQCKHGATIGPLDPAHLFYLQSRSIPRPEAVSMIVEGHFESALLRLPEALQERLRKLLRDRLRSI